MGTSAAQRARKSKPTAADLDAAERLRGFWEARKKERGLTQEVMAERLGNRTQGLVSQYLSGKIPLNYKAVMAFADALGVYPTAIRSDLPEMALALDASQHRRLDPEKIVITTRAINRILDRRTTGLRLDLTLPLHAELFAEVYAECQAMTEPEEADMLLVVVDLMAAREAKRGKEGEQTGGADRSGHRGARTG